MTAALLYRKSRAPIPFLTYEAAAEKFYHACLDSSLPEPSFADLLLFHARKASLSQQKEDLPADFAYYGGKDYYYETRINPLKNAVAKTLVPPVLALFSEEGPIAWPPP